jgi:hypothetical protein
MPRVSASWDGSVVAWASNFGCNASGYADIYSILVDTPPPAAAVADRVTAPMMMRESPLRPTS